MKRIIWTIVLTALVATSAQAIETGALLDSLQYTSFQYFWNEANASNGLIRDRSQPGSPCSIASLGFGISAIVIGIDHGWVSRDAGRGRILAALNTLWTKPQGAGATGYIGYKGLYYHFLDMNTAFRTWESEVSTIDSALLFAGILDAKQYFSTSDPLDLEVRSLADSIYYRADWEFFRNNTAGIKMGWKPVTGFSGFGLWIGYNEAMIIYLLALGSPTHPVPASTWNVWTSGYDWLTYYGQTHINFPPLFGHQYSHCWIDFRYIQDDYTRSHGITYFENSRRATLAQRAYCIDNPGQWTGYGENLWGITASDTPTGYRARGAPPPQDDDGTIAPTAPAGSIPFTPTESIDCLKNMYETYGPQLWSTYGFRDAFNLTVNWWDPDFIGIDQGPIIVMIENYRTRATWNRIMQNADVQTGLARAGFSLAADVALDPMGARPRVLLGPNSPNPFTGASRVAFQTVGPGRVRLSILDVSGRVVARPLDAFRPAGPQTVELDGAGLPCGVYYYKIETDEGSAMRRCVVLR